MHRRCCERSVLLVLMIAGVLITIGRTAAANLQECVPRKGLPHVMAKIARGETIRIAYLGGSITEAPGWRILSREWLARQYPQAHFEEIQAAIGGTGAEPGVARLKRDALDHKPDLIFVEFAVNGLGTTEQRSIQSTEGIARQTWHFDQTIDLCFVYTICEAMLDQYQHDQLPDTAAFMETVADHYGIPSINLGLSVAREVEAGRLLMKQPPAGGAGAGANDLPVFSPDGVHPFIEVGHPYYLRAIERSFPAIVQASKPMDNATRLVAPLDPLNWENAKLIPVSRVQRSAGWRQLDPKQIKRAEHYAPRLKELWTAKPGASLDFRFRGHGFGLHAIAGPDAGSLLVQVDDQAPTTVTLFCNYFSPGHYYLIPWFDPDQLKEGEHRVRIKLLEKSPDKKAILATAGHTMSDPAAFAGVTVHISNLVVVGDLLPEGKEPGR